MIGHLQRNKVKQLVGKVCRIHSVDSVRLAKQIQHDFAAKDETANILIEVNVAKEESKFGFYQKKPRMPSVKLLLCQTLSFTD